MSNYTERVTKLKADLKRRDSEQPFKEFRNATARGREFAAKRKARRRPVRK